MSLSKSNIIAQLQKEILPLQGYKHVAKDPLLATGLGPIRYAFPNATFPVGAVHEFFCRRAEDASATGGFIAGILSSLMGNTGASLWITSSGSIFPPALYSFGVPPDRIIFVKVVNEKERMWAMEEALKCNGLSAVISEMQEMSFTATRRLQLAVEQSRVTGFIIRHNPKNVATACVSRWRVTSLPTVSKNNLPGVGFPRWNVELLKIRNGTPGTWQVEWAGRFRHISELTAMAKVYQRKAG